MDAAPELSEPLLAETEPAQAVEAEIGVAETGDAQVLEAETGEAVQLEEGAAEAEAVSEPETAPPADAAAQPEAAVGADGTAEESASELSAATDQAVAEGETPATEPAAVDGEGGAATAVLEAEPEAPAPPVAPATQTYGELVVFYGGKGGVGTSVLAANLACALSREAGARVALVDLDLQFGDVGVLLNLPQTQSISDLVAAIDQMDPDFVNDVMADGPAGIRVLPAATSPELADLVAPEHVQKILEMLRKMFDFVVVDTSSNLGDVTLTALDLASSVILVTAPSITSVKNAKLALRLLESISIPTGAVTLVLNRCEAHTEFNKDSIESHLKFPITIQVPHDPRTVVNSINRGVPFVINNPEVEASQRVRQLAAHLLPENIRTAPPPPRNRGMLFGRR
jgi:Flp pilus assembly CpaE family ATPase